MFRMTVSDVFFITGRGLVATGKVEAGTLTVGDEVLINGAKQVEVTGIEAFRKKLDQAGEGENVGVLLKGLDKGEVESGDVLSDGAAAQQPQQSPFQPIPDATVQAQHDDANRALGRD